MSTAGAEMLFLSIDFALIGSIVGENRRHAAPTLLITEPRR